MSREQKKIIEEVSFLDGIFHRLFEYLPSFKVTDESVLPYGLKPHTRSVSWLVEQVITQQTKYRRAALELDDVSIDMPDTCLHDCEVKGGGRHVYVNVKIHNMGGKENKMTLQQLKSCTCSIRPILHTI